MLFDSEAVAQNAPNSLQIWTELSLNSPRLNFCNRSSVEEATLDLPASAWTQSFQSISTSNRILV